MKVALQLHHTRITDEVLSRHVLPTLERLGLDYELLPRKHNGDAQVSPDADFVLAIGGDGTFLTGAHAAVRHGLPIIGAKAGRLGFLCSVTMEEMEGALADIAAGKMQIGERHVLSGRVVSGKKVKCSEIAINDAVIFRYKIDTIRDLIANQDGQLIANYRADGIILSTALGSTAYNMAAGGPLVHPALNVMVLTPVCAHSLFTKPLVLPPDKPVEIYAREGSSPLLVTFDGVRKEELEAGDKLVVSMHDAVLKVYRPQGHKFYEVLRQKFQHGYVYGDHDA